MSGFLFEALHRNEAISQSDTCCSSRTETRRLKSRHLQFPPLVHPHPFVSVYFTGEPAHPYLGNVEPYAEDAPYCEAMWLLSPCGIDVWWRWEGDTQLHL